MGAVAAATAAEALLTQAESAPAVPAAPVLPAAPGLLVAADPDELVPLELHAARTAVATATAMTAALRLVFE
jgi:hypothetical protein